MKPSHRVAVSPKTDTFKYIADVLTLSDLAAAKWPATCNEGHDLDFELDVVKVVRVDTGRRLRAAIVAPLWDPALTCARYLLILLWKPSQTNASLGPTWCLDEFKFK